MIRSILWIGRLIQYEIAEFGFDRDLRRVVGQVHEQGDSVQTTVLLKVLLEESSSLHVDTHGSEDDGEVVGVSVVDTLGGTRAVNLGTGSVDETGLTTDLGGDLMSEDHIQLVCMLSRIQ